MFLQVIVVTNIENLLLNVARTRNRQIVWWTQEGNSVVTLAKFCVLPPLIARKNSFG